MNGSLARFWSGLQAAVGPKRVSRKKTLIVQPLPGIGDMIWHLPHIRAIARTTAEGQVDLLTKPRSATDRLLCADPSVGQVLWVERNPGRHDGLLGFLRLVGLLRRSGYRRVWIFHDSSRYALAALLAGIPERIGYGLGSQKYLLNGPVHLSAGQRRDHPIVKANRLLELMSVSRDESGSRLSVCPQAARQVAQRFGGVPPPWIALGIGSSEPFKQWGAARFADLARALDRPAGGLFIVGGPAERGLADDLLARAGGGRLVDAVALPIEQTAALLARCRLYVGNDTGALNMAAVLGVPTFGLFGGSEPLRHSRFIHPIVPPAGAKGMQAITVEQVLETVAGVMTDG